MMLNRHVLLRLQRDYVTTPDGKDICTANASFRVVCVRDQSLLPHGLQVHAPKRHALLRVHALKHHALLKVHALKHHALLQAQALRRHALRRHALRHHALEVTAKINTSTVGT